MNIARKSLLLVTISFIFCACQDTKQSSKEVTSYQEKIKDSIVKKELAEIDMNDVDSYPLFKECTELASKDKQKLCFEQVLLERFSEALSDEKFAVKEAVSDTIIVVGKISNKGIFIFDKTVCQNKTRKLLPELDNIIKAKMDHFDTIQPASKRGIHVGTQFQLPLIINVN